MTNSIIISGAAGNLGRSMTQKFLQEGFQVEAILGPSDQSNFMEHPNLTAQVVDVLNEDAASQFVFNVAQKANGIHGGVFLVGGFAMGGFKNTNGNDLLRMYQLNFESAYFLARPLLEVLEKQKEGGQLVFIGSRPAYNPEEGKNMVAYSLSKSLLFRLADLINENYKDSNITASVVVPATMDTPRNRESMPDADFEAWVPTDKVAESTHFLFTEAGRMLRHTELKVFNRS